MRVLMQMDATGYSVPGGHRRQMDKTAEYLGRLGVCIDVSSDPNADISNYDLVHCFATPGAFVRNAKHQCKPVALSPIYWSTDFFLNYARIRGPWAARHAEWVGRIRVAAAVLVQGRQALPRQVGFWIKHAEQSYTYRCADVLLPNARAEGNDLVRECGVDPARVHFVPNAVEAEAQDASPDPFYQQYNVRDFVLCVGRVEPRKNQLRLIRALRGSGMFLVIVDPVHPDHADYRAQCRREMGKDALYVQSLSNDMLKSAYAAARVHALPSFFETTGLVSLEAALQGCNVVANDQPHTREYFEDMAWYCNPADPRSIRQAIEAAFQAPFKSELCDHILDNYTWEHTARATLKGYQSTLASGSSMRTEAMESRI